MSDIKGLQQTSEKQIAAGKLSIVAEVQYPAKDRLVDLSRRPQFINPFLLACTSKNAKFAAIGMSCLQRLVVSQGLSKTRLSDVVDAMTECTTLSLDIQLKILQTLPSLLQNFADQLGGSLLFTILQICSTLQSSKTPSVSGTSAATLQQLVTSLYDKLSTEDGRTLELPVVTEVTVGEKKIPLQTVAHDAYRVFHDLCMLLEGSKPQFIRFSPTPESSLLETIESIFTGYGALINSHPEQAHLVQTVLIPHLTKTFSEKATFATTVRVTRLLYLIVKHFIDVFPDESETILQWFNHGLDPDATSLWKRVLCMEVFREIFADHYLTLQIHAQFNGKDNTKAMIPDSLASFVRLASEKPALIGLGQQSSLPIGHYFQRDTSSDLAEQNSNLLSTGSAGVPTSTVPGISAQFSSVKTPCIEQLDKQEPPNIPDTYIYSLVLGSLNNLSDSLAKFVLPLTVIPSKSKRRPKPSVNVEDTQSYTDAKAPAIDTKPSIQRNKSQKCLVNPLDLTDHPSYLQIHTAAQLIDQSWPAVLACCSTFLNAALDADNYRSLVRSFQKFAQVAGLLHMSVPRDAFLTTIGKSAMPPNLINAGIISAGSQPPSTPSFLSNAKGLLNVESIVSQASSFLPDRRRVSTDTGEPSLNVRNLLCLRALLNLAIALGPTLDESWSIVFETLQQADRVLASPGGRAYQTSLQSSSSTDGSLAQQIASEVTAVQAAASRLFESTNELTNKAFVCALKGLCGLVDARSSGATSNTSPQTVRSPQGPPPHRRIASFSGLSVKTGAQEHDFTFNLTKLREIASLNLERFVTNGDDSSTGWTIVIDHLSRMATNLEISAHARLLSIDIIRHLVLDCIASSSQGGQYHEESIQSKALMPLSKLSVILQQIESERQDIDETTIETHGIVMESLRGLLEQTGDVIVEGWPVVFDIIRSSFHGISSISVSKQRNKEQQLDLVSIKLGRSAFSSLQLTCSDFLSSNLNTSMSTLIDLLYYFASQEQDINISLTVGKSTCDEDWLTFPKTTTFYWNVSDFLYTALSNDTLDHLATKHMSDLMHINRHTLEQMSGSKDFAGIIWLYLLQRLADLISDPRHEVRNGAIHTILRIFDVHGDDLTPIVWKLCLDTILLPLMMKNTNSFGEGTNSVDSTTSEPMDDKIGTTNVLLQGFCKLFSDYLGCIQQAPGFSSIWTKFVTTLSRYLDYNLHDVTAAVWLSVDIVLSKASMLAKFDSQLVETIFSMWIARLPIAKSKSDHTLNTTAFEAYAGSFGCIYGFRKNDVTLEETATIVRNLESCIRNSDCPSYTSDLDSLTPLHTRVVHCLSILRIDMASTASLILLTLGRFIGLPFEKPSDVSTERKHGLTYIALSKASMDLAQKSILRDRDWKDILSAEGFRLVLTNLARSISVKYLLQKQGRSPPLWKKAVHTSLVIIEKSIPKTLEQNLGPNDLDIYWRTTVTICQNIAHAEIGPNFRPPDGSIPNDEEFDIEALRKLSSFIIPALGSSRIPDNVRRLHCSSLLTASFVHCIVSEEISHVDTDPLRGLYDTRFGRTHDPEPSLRPSMAYFSFRLLVSLLQKRDSTPEQIKLAKAAAPYVILRASIPLRAYIADQPLRGGLPMHEGQVHELLTVLRELRSTTCEPSAIPPTEKGTSNEGGHLIRLFPLVVAAAKINNGPNEVKEELFAWIKRVASEFGLPII